MPIVRLMKQFITLSTQGHVWFQKATLISFWKVFPQQKNDFALYLDLLILWYVQYLTEELLISSVIILLFPQNFSDTVLTLAESVVSCVKLLCVWLESVEPPELTEAVYEFRQVCRAATQSDVDILTFSSEVCAVRVVFVFHCIIV